MTPLDDKVLVGGQMLADAMPALAEYGVTMIVNNRPDGEEPGQPQSDELEEAARKAGLDYCHIPVAGGMAPQQVQAMAEALAAAEGKVLAFCKSGTRSTWLWALAEAARGGNADTLIRKAAAAGYDIEPLRPYL
jgi:uncharacterized protein (TIGR01244 family)